MKKGIDISNLSDSEFGILTCLNTVYQRKIDGGISYLNPAFRRLEGQEPLDIKNYSMSVDNIKDVNWREMKEFAEKTPENIMYVMRDSGGELIGILHLAGARQKRNPNLRYVPSVIADAIEKFRKKYGGFE